MKRPDGAADDAAIKACGVRGLRRANAMRGMLRPADRSGRREKTGGDQAAAAGEQVARAAAATVCRVISILRS